MLMQQETAQSSAAANAHLAHSHKMECVLQEEMGPPMPREAWPPGMPPQHYRGGPRPPHPASMEGVSGSPVNELGQCLTPHAG